MILRLLNWQGIAGIGLALALAVLLAVQKGETRHWKKQSAGFEQLYHDERATLAGMIANYHAAAEQARAADQANTARIAAEQHTINERTSHDYEMRLAAARAVAADITRGRLRLQPEAAADPSARRGAPMPRLSPAPGGAAQAAGESRLSPEDALTATEQAIQLDELIKWVKAQASVDPNEVQK